METRRRIATAISCIAALLFVLPACNTVIKPISKSIRPSAPPDLSRVPAETLRALASAIEREVRDGNRRATFENAGLAIGEEVLQAIHTRAARGEIVNAFLDTGFGWEKNNGLLAILRSNEYRLSGSSRSKDRDALVVMGENDDRWAIYEGLVAANGLGNSSLSAVQAIFAQVRIELLPAGQKYQDDAGEVAFKGD